jgi:tRNA U34 5-carboxymethylaminomethyl modifying enzyme MnmG/GidA
LPARIIEFSDKIAILIEQRYKNMMRNNESFEIQNQIRQTVMLNQENIRDLKNWETEMKIKESELLKQKELQFPEIQVNIHFWFLIDYFIIYLITIETTNSIFGRIPAVCIRIDEVDKHRRRR